jgi:hypothetical protein
MEQAHNLQFNKQKNDFTLPLMAKRQKSDATTENNPISSTYPTTRILL